MDKKDWIAVECGVCKKEFKIPIDIEYKTDDPDFVIAALKFCSKECQDIAEETMNNKSDRCSRCNKRLDNYDGSNGYFADFKNKISKPMCDDCDKIFSREFMESLE